MKKDSKLGLVPLIFLIIGSMIGSGVFGLPGEMAASTSAGAMLIGWLITGVGMVGMVMVFTNLSMRRPDLNSGIYSYARAGFGDYIGFNSALGYWVSALLANISYCVVIFNCLSYFFPVFDASKPEGAHAQIIAFIGGSVIIWVIFLLISRGIKQAAIVNIVVQVAKLLPILFFIIVVIFVFHWKQFSSDFFGADSLHLDGTPLGGIGKQVTATMIVTLWCFQGIEGSVVVSERAKRRKDIGRSTVIGLVCALLIYMMVSVMTQGYMSRAAAEGLPTPSMAYALEQMVGPGWGAVVIVGQLISVCGALLGWTILASETFFVAAKEKTMPKFLAKENKRQAPINSALVSTLFLQAMMIVVLINDSTYQMVYAISTSTILLPYLFSCLYGFKLAATGVTYDASPKGRTKDLIFGALASLYAIWMIYAAGLTYVLMAMILYAIGIILYIMVQKENGRKLFNSALEITIFSVITAAAIVAVVLLATGVISWQ